MSEVHHLREKDPDDRTALCSVCGPTRIAPVGRGWICVEVKRRANRRWAQSHPDRPRASGPHRLEWQDRETLTGLCPTDGAVDIVPWGRGYACATRAKELGRVHQQEAPQTFCADCRVADGVIVWLTTEGECPRCQETNLNLQLASQEADRRLAAELLEPGMHVIGLGDPYEMPSNESAVPGWRTIA